VRYLLRGEAPSEVLHAVAAPRRALPCLSDHLVSGCSGMGGRLHTPHPSYLGPSPQLDAQRELGHHLCHPGGAACARRERCFTFREQMGEHLGGGKGDGQACLPLFVGRHVPIATVAGEWLLVLAAGCWLLQRRSGNGAAHEREPAMLAQAGCLCVRAR